MKNVSDPTTRRARKTGVEGVVHIGSLLGEAMKQTTSESDIWNQVIDTEKCRF